MKKIRLTEKDLQRIVKRTISEQDMGDEEMVNPRHQPITIEMIKKEVKLSIMERESILEQIPSDKVSMVVNEIAEIIIESFHDKLDYIGDDLDYLVQEVLVDLPDY
jgi:hypothetical protein